MREAKVEVEPGLPDEAGDVGRARLEDGEDLLQRLVDACGTRLVSDEQRQRPRANGASDAGERGQRTSARGLGQFRRGARELLVLAAHRLQRNIQLVSARGRAAEQDGLLPEIELRQRVDEAGDHAGQVLVQRKEVLALERIRRQRRCPGLRLR